MRIIHGLTGSVASILADKITEALYRMFGNTFVDVVASASAAAAFMDGKSIHADHFYQDCDEWTWKDANGVLTTRWKKGDPILHIELRKKASALVVAPCSANKIGEFANAMAPGGELLSSLALAWDYCRPFIIAPAMNTRMWFHPGVQDNLARLKKWGVIVVEPVNKMLACNDEGMGAMADIADIVRATKEALRWHFPIGSHPGCPGIPVSHHPGAFGFHRKQSHHTGVDLYANDHSCVYAVEAGRVVDIEHFTGAWDNSPWWNETDCILVEGASGVVCYGEVTPMWQMTRGSVVKKGQCIAHVRRVLKDGKERPDIPGHKTSMLHVELYPHGTTQASKSWKLEPEGQGCRRPEDLMDPTPWLIDAEGAPETRLSM